MGDSRQQECYFQVGSIDISGDVKKTDRNIKVKLKGAVRPRDSIVKKLLNNYSLKS